MIHCFLPLSNFYVHTVICSKVFKLDPHTDKLPDPNMDQQKLNSDPQPYWCVHKVSNTDVQIRQKRSGSSKLYYSTSILYSVYLPVLNK